MSNQEQKLQELQTKNQRAAENAIRLNTQIEHAQEQLSKLRELALQKFGENDLEKLKEKAASWEKTNEEKLNEYEKKIMDLGTEITNKHNAIKQIQQS